MAEHAHPVASQDFRDVDGRVAAARTCDLIPTAGRIAELIHPELDLGERVSRLAVRLTLGVPAMIVEFAQQAGADLFRGDYRRMAGAKLCDPDAIDAADDDTILACVDQDRRRLEIVRRSAVAIRRNREQAAIAITPILEPYVA